MPQPFGGAWTKEKLAVLAAYLDAYTTALKNQHFDLVYLDAFAGNGYWRPKASDSVYDGSPRIALKIDDKPFDKVVLIEKDPANCDSLRALHGDFPRRTSSYGTATPTKRSPGSAAACRGTNAP